MPETDDDKDSVVNALIGSAVARRVRQFYPAISEELFLAVAVAGTEVMRIATTSDDPLAALDQFHIVNEWAEGIA